MPLDEALAIFEYYKMNPPMDARSRRLAMTVETLVVEAAKGAIRRYIKEERNNSD